MLKFLFLSLLFLFVFCHHHKYKDRKLKDGKYFADNSNSDKDISYYQKFKMPSKGNDDAIDDAFDIYLETKISSSSSNDGKYHKYDSKSSSSFSSSSSSSSESDEDYFITVTQSPPTTKPGCTGCANPVVVEPQPPPNERWNVAAVLTPAVEEGCDILNVKCDFTDQPEPQALKTGYMIFNGNENLNVNPSIAQAVVTTSLTCTGGTLKFNGGNAVNSVSCESSFCDTCEILTGLEGDPGQSPLPIITYNGLNGEACRKGTITCDFSNDNPTTGILYFGLIGMDGVVIDYVGQTPGPPATRVTVEFTCDFTGYGIHITPTGETIEFQVASCTGNP